MPTRHCLLALLVAVLWGVNFIAIHASLEQFPPFFAVALRWLPLAVAAVLFVPKPDVAWRWIVLYGLGFGILQFTFLYWGMATGMPAGLASLVLQSSAPFTVVLGAFLGERLSPRRGLGVLIAIAGLAVVGSQRGDVSSVWPFVLTVLGGLGWAFGNLAVRRARTTQPFHLTMWMSVVPPIPMLVLSVFVEGPQRIVNSLTSVGSPVGAAALAGLVYTSVIATVLGTGIWSWLMARHPAGTVAPFSMLVPVTGLTAAWVVLGERPSLVEWLGCAVVVAGVLLTAGAGPTLRVGRHTPTSASTLGRSPLSSAASADSALAPTAPRPRQASLRLRHAERRAQSRGKAAVTSRSRSLASRSAIVARTPSVP